MVNHAFYIPLGGGKKSLVELKLCATRNEFFTEMAEIGDNVTDMDKDIRGISFQYRCSTTQSKKSVILTNAETVDVETIGHEVRHAMFWAFSDSNGQFVLNLMDEDAEEHFNRLVDDMTLHVVRFIEQRYNYELPYVHGHVHDPDYETEIPEDIKRLIEGE